MSKRRKTWSNEEDRQLFDLVHQSEIPIDWIKISKSFPDKSARQCFDRYYDTLDPQLKSGPLTEVEIRYKAGEKMIDIAHLLHYPRRSIQEYVKRIKETGKEELRSEVETLKRELEEMRREYQETQKELEELNLKFKQFQDTFEIFNWMDFEFLL